MIRINKIRFTTLNEKRGIFFSYLGNATVDKEIRSNTEIYHKFCSSELNDFIRNYCDDGFVYKSNILKIKYHFPGIN